MLRQNQYAKWWNENSHAFGSGVQYFTACPTYGCQDILSDPIRLIVRNHSMHFLGEEHNEWWYWKEAKEVLNKMDYSNGEGQAAKSGDVRTSVMLDSFGYDFFDKHCTIPYPAHRELNRAVSHTHQRERQAYFGGDTHKLTGVAGQ